MTRVKMTGNEVCAGEHVRHYFQEELCSTLGLPGKYHMYPAFVYCYQDCGSYMRRQGPHRAPVLAI